MAKSARNSSLFKKASLSARQEQLQDDQAAGVVETSVEKAIEKADEAASESKVSDNVIALPEQPKPSADEQAAAENTESKQPPRQATPKKAPLSKAPGRKDPGNAVVGETAGTTGGEEEKRLAHNSLELKREQYREAAAEGTSRGALADIASRVGSVRNRGLTGESMCSLQVRLTRKQRDKAQAIAKAAGITVSDMIRALIDEQDDPE